MRLQCKVFAAGFVFIRALGKEYFKQPYWLIACLSVYSTSRNVAKTYIRALVCPVVDNVISLNLVTKKQCFIFSTWV